MPNSTNYTKVSVNETNYSESGNATGALLLETGGKLLLEDGNALGLEKNTQGRSTNYTGTSVNSTNYTKV